MVGGAGRGVLPAVQVDQLRQRDERDEQRAHAPMKPAENALVIDTSDLTIAQVVEMIAKKVSG